MQMLSNVSFVSSLPWIGPALVLILLVVIWPVIELIRLSFTDISLAGSLLDFNGLNNFDLNEKDQAAEATQSPLLTTIRPHYTRMFEAVSYYLTF